LDEWHGVDFGQIRRQFRMSVADRVRTMVEAANAMIALRDHARERRFALTDRRLSTGTVG
jgi:hypothetical protein